MPLTLPGHSTSTLASDIRWIFRDYHRDPRQWKAIGPHGLAGSAASLG